MLKDRIKELAANYLDDTIAIRRHLHAHPELSFKEYQTSEYVARQLQDIGVRFDKGIVETGLVAYVEGRNPEKKVISLRADLDALPIVEENDVPYKSQNEGVMHACGHDVHTSSLLGVIRILNTLRSEFEGTVKCIFQPGEERLPGGASLMIKEGVLENPAPELMFGQHVYPQLEAGKVGFRPGMYMASADEIYVTITGRGGHAALPHLNVDPVLISAHLLVALQQIVSRNAQPNVPTVLSFGKVTANGATNVIPEKVYLEGTFRTMDEEWRASAHEKMIKMGTQLVESMGGSCEFEIRKGYPFLVNDTELTTRAKDWATAYLGAENVVDLDLRMTAEDFAYFSQQLPACFYRLGISNKQLGINSGLHTSTFNIDEKSLETGMGLMAWMALNELRA